VAVDNLLNSHRRTQPSQGGNGPDAPRVELLETFTPGAESDRLLSGSSSVGVRGFESHPLRHAVSGDGHRPFTAVTRSPQVQIPPPLPRNLVDYQHVKVVFYRDCRLGYRDARARSRLATGGLLWRRCRPRSSLSNLD
jgi:hypothetical protein